MPQLRSQRDQSHALTDEHRQRGTPEDIRRSNLKSETAMRLQQMRFQQMLGDSPRQRVLKSSRLTLGGAILGTALTGLIGRLIVGGNDSTLLDLMGAVAGAAVVAAGLLSSYHSHR